MTHESLVARCSACRYTLVRIAILVSLALGIFSISPRCHGADIHVPRDHSTISAAMAAAESGDVILVAPGLYKNERRAFLGHTLRRCPAKPRTGTGDDDDLAVESHAEFSIP